MARHGTTAEQFAKVAAKNYRHGAANPNAAVRRAFTVEEVLRSSMRAPSAPV